MMSMREGCAMNKLPIRSWWNVNGFLRSVSAGDDDYADMGTELGLDASLAPAPDNQDKDEGPDYFNERLERRSTF